MIKCNQFDYGKYIDALHLPRQGSNNVALRSRILIVFMKWNEMKWSLSWEVKDNVLGQGGYSLVQWAHSVWAYICMKFWEFSVQCNPTQNSTDYSSLNLAFISHTLTKTHCKTEYEYLHFCYMYLLIQEEQYYDIFHKLKSIFLFTSRSRDYFNTVG